MEFVDETTVSRRIKAFRVLKGYTQAEMAGKLGITTQVYAKYEHKPYSIPLRKLTPIADTLGCKVADFFVA